MLSESQIQQQVIQYLSLIRVRYNFVYFSVPNEAWGAGKSKKKLSGPEYNKIRELKKMGMTPGVSDLVIVQNGKAYFIEMKTSKGEQSSDQILFMKNILNAGCDYAVCRSVDDVKECLKAWGIV